MTFLAKLGLFIFPAFLIFNNTGVAFASWPADLTPPSCNIYLSLIQPTPTPTPPQVGLVNNISVAVNTNVYGYAVADDTNTGGNIISSNGLVFGGYQKNATNNPIPNFSPTLTYAGTVAYTTPISFTTNSNGYDYLFNASCTDALGNTSTATATIYAPAYMQTVGGDVHSNQ